MASARDQELAARAKACGAGYSLWIILESRRAGIPVSLAFALVEQESGFRNVFGHDATTSIPEEWKGAPVTRGRYLRYRERRAACGMQGVGPCQLTWWEFQDEADRRGGCWVAAVNIAVAFDHLAGLLERYGRREGLERYNGSGAQARRYATQVLGRMDRWHQALGG